MEVPKVIAGVLPSTGKNPCPLMTIRRASSRFSAKRISLGIPMMVW